MSKPSSSSLLFLLSSHFPHNLSKSVISFPYCSHSLDPFPLFFPLAYFSSCTISTSLTPFPSSVASSCNILTVSLFSLTYIHLHYPLLFIVSPLYPSSSLSLHIWISLLNHPFLSSFMQSFHSPLHPPPQVPPFDLQITKKVKPGVKILVTDPGI